MDNKLNYKAKGNPRGFLRKTIRNIELEEFNSNKLKFHSLNEMENNKKLYIAKDLNVPVHSLETKERNQIVIEAISELPPKSREAIELVYFEGIPAKQAAESIGCEFKRFRKRITYAIKQLRKKLEKYIVT